MNKNHNLLQIFYSETTKNQNDVGFIQLDNSNNERPDLREFWPIKKFFSQNDLIDSQLYGFFSPKFQDKTGLTSKDVKTFIEMHDADIYLFSPFFDQSAFQFNIFYQGDSCHPGFMLIAQDFFNTITSANLEKMIMDSSNTVFSNYFVAKGSFWKEWLQIAEKIFLITEENNTDLGNRLNNITEYKSNTSLQHKVFLIERIASFILNTQKWNVKVYDPTKLPLSQKSLNPFIPEFCVLDALKIAYRNQPFKKYLEEYLRRRSTIAEKHNSSQIREYKE